MGMTLREFLESQEEQLKAGQPQAIKRRDEWIAAVDRLEGRIRDWLASSDPRGLLEVRAESCELREQGIGLYRVGRLVMAMGPRIVRLDPVARNVVGPLSSTGVVHVIRAYGRMDLTDGLRRYYLYRTEVEPEDRWSLIKEDGYDLQPLNQASFEAALQDLLE